MPDAPTTILLVTHYYPSHGGGIEIVAGALASMIARDADVVWAASDCDAPPAPMAGVRCIPMRSNNAVERATGLPFPLWGPFSLLRLWRETGRADLVHLHDFAYVGNCAAFVFARLRRKPTIITQHVGLIPYRSRLLRAALRTLHATIGRFVLGRADHVVFISAPVRDYFAAFVRFRRPPHLIENGVDSDTFRAARPGDRAAARAALGLPQDRPVLLFVGRFVEKKGLHILEALARRMADITWVFAGWGPLDPRQWNGPHVHVFDGLRGAALVPLYHAADLVVLPSVGEGLPLVAQEAMSCGTPVIAGEDTAAAIGAPADVVYACRVAGPETVDTWEAALRRILARGGETDEQHATVARVARQKWSWPACGRAYLSIFKER